MKVKLQFVQVLRGFAALIVVLVHVHVVLTIPNSDKILNSIRGNLGVPLFFILSGFIMVFTTQKRSKHCRKEIKEFLLKRLFRIVPLFYFSILLYFLINMINPVSFTKHNLEYIVRLLCFIPLFSDKTGPFYGISFLYVNWSLNYEMMFYCAFALSFLFRKYSYHFLYLLLLSMIFLVPILSIGFVRYDNSIYYDYKVALLNFFTNPISLLFLIGITFGLAVKKINVSNRFVKIFVTLSVVLFALYFLSIIPYTPVKDTLVCSLLVFSILLLDFNISTIKLPRILTYLGDISYSIYLIHPLVLMILGKLLKLTGTEKIAGNWYFLAIIYFTVIFFSVLTYEVIERRLTGFLKYKFLNHGESKQVEKSKILKPAVTTTMY